MKKVLKWVGITFIVLIVLSALSSSNKSSTGNIKQSTTNSNTTNTENVPKNTPVPVGKVEVKSQTKRVEYGYPKIVGEVVNNTDKPVTFVKVTATYYDAQEKVVGTDFTYAGDTASTPLITNATTPFEVTHLGPLDYETYKLDVIWQ